MQNLFLSQFGNFVKNKKHKTFNGYSSSACWTTAGYEF